MNRWHSDYHSPHRALSFEVTRSLYTEKSEYQEIEILETPEFGKVMLLDGVLMVTEKDEFVYHEMLAHPALFTHPKPARVLIIGGGDCGTLSRVLMHKEVDKLVQVELDEMVTQVSREYFPALTAACEDPRVELIFGDGIKYLRETQAKFDVILIDSTDPVGPAEGLFRRPFFADCKRVLNDDGILCLQSESPWIEDLRPVISEVNRDLHSLFPIVRAYSAAIQTYQAGFWLFQIASLAYDPCDQAVYERITEAGLKCSYYHANLHFSSFVLPAFVEKLLN